MDGIHDMGGMHGLGAVVYEADEPVFHHAWEGRMFGIAQGATGHPAWSVDYFRFMRECMPPELYLTLDYYDQWYYAHAVMYLESGMVTAEELRTGRAQGNAPPRDDAMSPERPLQSAYKGSDSRREIAAPPAFAVGDAVRTKNLHPAGHTRLPRYARGKRGIVRARRGAHVFPDSNAHGLGEDPRHLYSVEITARALWGPEAAPRDKVYLDLWEPYLEPA